MSGRIRTVKPEWLDDEKIALASPEARVLSIALLLLADDFGNGRASSVMLQSRVFPGLLGDHAERALVELAAIGYAFTYTVGEQRYFSIRNWDKHQRVEKRGKPKVPSPPALASIPGMVGEPSGNAPGIVDDSSAPPPARATPTPTDPDPIPIPDPEQLLTPEQRARLAVQMVPAWAVDVMLTDLHLATVGGSKRMPIDQWHSYAAKALTRRWNNAAERPKEPARATTAAEQDEITRRRLEAEARLRERKRAELGLASPLVGSSESVQAAIASAVQKAQGAA
jgi:hypothetical protein